MGILLAVILISVVWSAYNRVVALKNSVKRSWQHLLTLEKAKLSILNELEEELKNQQLYKGEIVAAISNMRTVMADVVSDDYEFDCSQLGKARQSTHAVTRLLKETAEVNPGQTYKDVLGNFLAEEENTLAALAIYSESVKRFNTGITTFPGSIINSLLIHEILIREFTDDDSLV